MSKVLLINQFFYPDVAPTGQFATDLAEDLVRRGLEVSVLCSRRRYGGVGSLAWRETYQGIQIYRTGSTRYGRRRTLGRALDYFSFYLTAGVKALVLPRYDLVICLSTPPLIAGLGVLLKWVKGSRYVYWVQDLYPDVAVALGVLREKGMVTGLVRHLSRLTLCRADAVVALGEVMAEKLSANGFRPKNLSVLPCWADGEELRLVPHKMNPFIEEQGLSGKFIGLYSGNMGKGHELDTLLGAIEALREVEDLLFVFIGDGARRSEIERFQKTKGLQNLRLLPYQDRHRVCLSLNAGDVHLVTLREGLEGLLVPSKIYSSLATGKPVIYIGPERSEVGEIVRRADCGYVHCPGDVEGVVRSVREMISRPEKRERLGRNGRAYFEAHFERRQITEKFYQVIRDVLSVA